jgi:hypothetical protein
MRWEAVFGAGLSYLEVAGVLSCEIDATIPGGRLGSRNPCSPNRASSSIHSPTVRVSFPCPLPIASRPADRSKSPVRGMRPQGHGQRNGSHAPPIRQTPQPNLHAPHVNKVQNPKVQSPKLSNPDFTADHRQVCFDVSTCRLVDVSNCIPWNCRSSCTCSTCRCAL